MSSSTYGQAYPVPSVCGLQTAGGAQYDPGPEYDCDNSRQIFPVSPLQRITCAVPRPGVDVRFGFRLAANLRAGRIDK